MLSVVIALATAAAGGPSKKFDSDWFVSASQVYDRACEPSQSMRPNAHNFDGSSITGIISPIRSLDPR